MTSVHPDDDNPLHLKGCGTQSAFMGRVAETPIELWANKSTARSSLRLRPHRFRSVRGEHRNHVAAARHVQPVELVRDLRCGALRAIERAELVGNAG